MSLPDGQDLAPDKALLSCIFPHFEPASTAILAQTYETCTFTVHINDTGRSGELHGDLVVRLQLPGNHLDTVSALQRVASLAIPELVPAVLQTGTAKTEDGKELDFMVSNFIVDTASLETVWNDLTTVEQLKLMNAVSNALSKLQALDLTDASVRETLKAANGALLNPNEPRDSTPSTLDVALGTPEIGFFKDVPALLDGIIAYNDLSEELTSSLDTKPEEGVVISSTLEGVSAVQISQKELAMLQQRIVLCHNDLEPRNLLVRSVHSGNGSIHYELAAIIDWEMAGFFPFAYEYFSKDGLLGTSNLSFTWYTLFKQCTASLLPATPSSEHQRVFMQAMNLIQQSQTRRQKETVGGLFREKWIEREQLVPGNSLWCGWVRRIFSKEDDELLETQVLKELNLL